MKIGILVGEIPPPYFIDQLVCNIADNNHTVHLYGSSKGKDCHYNKSSIFLRVKPKNKVSLFFKTILTIIKLMYLKSTSFPQLLSQIWTHDKRTSAFFKRCSVILPPFLDDLDIFHIQWVKTLVYYPEFIERLNCPIVLSLRGTHINVSPLADKNLASLYKKYFSQVNGYHAVSHSIAKEAEKYGADPNKITVIHPAVKHKLINDVFKINVPNKIIQIISVGRCHWIKGYTFALDTMVILKKEDVQFHYTIIASGRDQENIHYQIHDLGLTEHVTFINGLPNNEVIEQLSKSDLFLLPSVGEGISNAVLESMALGISVISTDCGGMSEVIEDGENGFIVPIRGSQLMAIKIKEFIRMRKQKKLEIIKKAVLTIKDNYLLKKQIDEIILFYYTTIRKYYNIQA